MFNKSNKRCEQLLRKTVAAYMIALRGLSTLDSYLEMLTDSHEERKYIRSLFPEGDRTDWVKTIWGCANVTV